MKKFGAIILAAGSGTRFNEGKPSPKPKVLYEVLGKPLIIYGLEALKKIGVAEVAIVVGHRGDEVRKFLGSGFKYALQKNPLGTADAALVGLAKITPQVENVIVLYGADIYTEDTLKGALETHFRENSIATFVTNILDDPTGFGRIVRSDNGQIQAIVEEKIASDEQKKIKEVNDGCYIFNRDWLAGRIKSLSASKIGEYFLTDLIEVAISEGSKISTYTVKSTADWIGIDSLEDMKNAEEVLGKS